MFSYSTRYYVSPPDDQYLKFKNRCSLPYMIISFNSSRLSQQQTFSLRLCNAAIKKKKKEIKNKQTILYYIHSCNWTLIYPAGISILYILLLFVFFSLCMSSYSNNPFSLLLHLRRCNPFSCNVISYISVY